MEVKLVQVMLYYCVLVICLNNISSVQSQDISHNETKTDEDAENKDNATDTEFQDQPFHNETKIDEEAESNDNATDTESQNKPVDKEIMIDEETDSLENATVAESTDRSVDKEIKIDEETDSHENATDKESQDPFHEEIGADEETGSNNNATHSDSEDSIKLNATDKELYDEGVKSKLFKPQKYTYHNYSQHVPSFRSTYKEFTELTKNPIKYKQWVIMNTFGILQDVHESLLNEKERSDYENNKNKFKEIVRPGDILLTNGKDEKGTLGLASLMLDEYNILEMSGLHTPDNGMIDNLRVNKEDWFTSHLQDWVHIYRCRNSSDADSAANWAHHNYYNPDDIGVQVVNVTYYISSDFLSTNPSYGSKMVLQAYYFGSNAINKKNVHKDTLVFPTTIAKYFKEPLEYVGKY